MQIIDYRALKTSESYILQINNQSAHQFSFVCFQPVPSNAPSGTYPLAWFAKPLASKTNGYFAWQPTFDLTWAETGRLKVGDVVRVGQFLRAKLNSDNQTTLARVSGAYRFGPQTEGAAGKLTIKVEGTIPNDTVSVGLGMNKQPTAAVQAMPNVTTEFAPVLPLSYSVGFSNSEIRKGQVLEPEPLADACCQIKFPANKFGAVAVLQENNSWKVNYKTYIDLKRF